MTHTSPTLNGVALDPSYEDSDKAAAPRSPVDQILSQSELLHQQLLKHLPEAVYTCDPSGRVILYNDAAVKLWGREPVIGQDRWCGSWKIFKPDGAPLPLDECPMAQVLRTGVPVHAQEIIIERPDGTRRHVVPHPQPIKDSRGNVVGAVNMLVDITDRKQAQNTQALLSAIVESSDDAIISMTLDGRITSWNAGAKAMYGYSVEEAVGKPVSMLIPEGRRANDAALLERLRRGERIDHFETVRLTKNRELIEVSLTVSPICDDSGTIIGASKIARDITQRKQFRRALRDIQERFARFMQHLPGLAWIKDPEGRYVYVNDAAERAFDIARSSLYGKTDADVFPATTAKAFRANDRRAIGSDQAIETIETLEQEDGVHHSLVTKFPIPGDGDAPTLVGGIAIDVTDRMNAELALRESEQRFRSMADEAPVLIWINDRNGCEFVNRAYLMFTGCEIEDVQGMKWTQHLHPDDADEYLREYARAMSRGAPFEAQTRFRRADGDYRWLRSTGMPRMAADGSVVGYVGCSMDITDQMKAREALELQQNLLEDAVLARTAQLEESNQRLRLAERMASLGTLSAGLGHDMGNLLVPLRVRLESLTVSGLSQQQKEDVDAIGTAAEYLQRLSTGLRMLASDPHRERVGEFTEIVTWWNDAGILLKNAVPRFVRLQSQIPKEACCVRIARSSLTQIVYNLVQNAGEAMKTRGEGVVMVAIEPNADAVRIQVKDNGPGMTEEVRKHCMEPFFTTKPRGISTGMGLVLVFGLVRDAGGTVNVESKQGQGTTFIITLPLYIPTRTNSKIATGSRKAFVRLNDPRLQAFISAELRQRSYDVTSDASEIINSELVVGSDFTPGVKFRPGARILAVGHVEDPVRSRAAVVLEPRPSPQEIRVALRQLTESSD